MQEDHKSKSCLGSLATVVSKRRGCSSESRLCIQPLISPKTSHLLFEIFRSMNIYRELFCLGLTSR